MKSKAYKITTTGDYELDIQKVFTTIYNGVTELPIQDEIAITLNDGDNEAVCYIDKDNAIILAEKLLKIANGIKPPVILKSI